MIFDIEFFFICLVLNKFKTHPNLLKKFGYIILKINLLKSDSTKEVRRFSPIFDPYPPHFCNRLHFKYPSLKRTSANWEFDPPPSTFMYVIWPTQKKFSFSKSPILKILLHKFQRLVLGLGGLIDAKGTDLAQPTARPRFTLSLCPGKT